MGWKTFKERYHIGHTVQVTSEGVCIGSAYCHNLATIDPSTGKVVKEALPPFLSKYYPALLEVPAEEIASALAAPDTFAASITVYTYDAGDIIEKKCEALGWPNITHDGQMMHDNTHSANKDEVVAWAKQEAAALVRANRGIVEQKEEDLATWHSWLAESLSAQSKLERDYPTIAAASWHE